MAERQENVLRNESKTIKLSESQLNQIISESVRKVLAEAEENEGFFNNMKSAFQGAKRGYQNQKTIDRGTEGFKQQHDSDDVMKSMKNPLSKMDNTAEEQCAQIYKQYKDAYMEANRLLNLYNKMIRQYGLSKQAVGQHVNPNKTAPGPVPNLGGARANSIGASRNFKRDDNPLSNNRMWQ